MAKRLKRRKAKPITTKKLVNFWTPHGPIRYIITRTVNPSKSTKKPK